MNIEPNSTRIEPKPVLAKTVLLIIGFDGGIFPKSMLEDPSVKTSTATGAKTMGRFSDLTHTIYCSSTVDKQLSGRLATIARRQSIGFVIVSPQSIVESCQRFLKTKDSVTVEAEPMNPKKAEVIEPKPSPKIQEETKRGKKILVVSSSPQAHARFKGAESVVVINGGLLLKPEDVSEPGTFMTAIIDRQSHRQQSPRLIDLLEKAGLAPVRIFDSFVHIEAQVEKLCELHKLVFPLRPIASKVKTTEKPVSPVTPAATPPATVKPITPPATPKVSEKKEEIAMPIQQSPKQPTRSRSQREIIEECISQGMSKLEMRRALESGGFTNKNSNDQAIYLAMRKAKDRNNSTAHIQAPANGQPKPSPTDLMITTPAREGKMVRASPVIPARNNGHRAMGPIIDAVQTSGQIDLLESMIESATEHLDQLKLALENAKADQANFAEIREILTTAMDKLPR